MAKAINRLAVQQSLVQNGVAEHEAAGNVANVLGDEIDGAMADLVTKRDLDEAVAQINKRMDDGNAELRLEMATQRTDMEARDRERAERESEWWRRQQERDDKWRAEQQARDDAWRKELQARDDARQKRDDEWRKEQRERDDKAREEQQRRDDQAREREQEAAKMTSRILWAIFGSAGALGAAVGIALAFTGG